jgi:hypothetical protein
VSAQTIAPWRSPSHQVRWDELERAAFAEHPSVLGASRLGRKTDGSKGGFVSTLLIGIPLVVVYLACVFSPIWGFAVVYDGFIAAAAPKPDYESAIPVSGVFFAIAGVTLLTSTIHWLITGMRRNGFYQIKASLALVLVLGAITALVITANGRAREVTDWELWIIPVLATAGFGALFLLAHLIVSLRRGLKPSMKDAEAQEPPMTPAEMKLLKRRHHAVATLSAQQQASIRHDLTAAIDDLETRDLISASESQRVRAIELGALGCLGPHYESRPQRPA